MAYLGEYIEVGWENEPSQRTPVNAYNLGIMEDGIKRLFAYLIAGGGSGSGGGSDGREIELRNNGEYIQWRYSGEEDWTNLVALADLKGEKGDNYILTEEDIEEIASKVKVATSADKITYDDTETQLGADDVQGAIGKLSEQIEDLKENGTTGGTVVSSVEPMDDDIPKVFFSEAIPQTKDDVVTKFRYISKTKDFSGYAEFKAQGNSSMAYPKKNMTVKMYVDESLEEKLKVDFKGWGKQRKHVYKANWIDLTHARNVVSARIWADIVKSRADYLSLPELLRTSPSQGAVDGFPVKVYSQGIYQGRYTLNIPKDAWMGNMDDSLNEHCILCGEGYQSGCFREASMTQWTDEVHDSMPTSIRTRWLEIIDFVMNSTDEDFKANLENYFFVDSLIDYFIFAMVSCGLDAFGKNQLYFTYDGVKWIASMYDMDATWGLYWNGSKFVLATYTREDFEDFVSASSSGEGNLLYIRLVNLFHEEIQSRYEELKQGVLSIPNIINHFERFTDIAPLDLVKEDYASTTGSGNFINIPSKSTNNIQQIRQFVIDRYVYCDEYFASLGENGGEVEPDEPDNPEVTLTSISATYTGGAVAVGTAVSSLTGITVTGTYSDGTTSEITGYTLSGEIVEGSNTITVSYGGKTTTFTVTGVELPEVVNTFDEAEFYNGYERDRTTGELNEKSLHVVTGKFLLGGLHNLTVSSGTYEGIHIWDENDEYIGYFEKLSAIGIINADSNYKYSLQLYNPTTTDKSVFSVEPLNNGIASKTINLLFSDLEWTTTNNYVEATVTEQLASIGVTSANYKNTIKYVSGWLNFGQFQDRYRTSTEPLLPEIIDYNGNLILKVFEFGTNVDTATTYFAENETSLTIGA